MPEGPRKYLPLFISEASEQLEQLGSELVRIEQEPPGGPLWDSIFRRVHSVKGSAATIGLQALVDIAHAAETLIDKLKGQKQRPAREQVDLLFEATDALVKEVQRAAVETERAKQDAVASPLAARLADAAKSLVGATPVPGVAKVAAKPPEKPTAPAGIPRLDVFVSLVKNCQAPGARALIVQRKLKALGTLLELEPTPQQLMQKKGGVRLSAILATQRPIDEVRGAFSGVPEVEGVEVRPTPAASAPKHEQRSATPTPAPIRVVPEPAADVSKSGVREGVADATVRVRAQALDELLDQAAEVLHGIARLRDAARLLPDPHANAFETEIDRLRRTARELHGRVMTARLIPFSAVTERLPRAVRDLCSRLGKEVDLEIHGAEVELDRTVVEALGDPLSHLIRNALDHGIEPPAQRVAQGKLPRGKLVLAARGERDKVHVEVSDDGRGFDSASLRKKAVASGILREEQAAALGDAQALELAFLPGISTRAQATDVSGRGVGLDAVKGAIEGLGGKVSVRSTAGRGAKFVLELPLAVSMTNLLLVQVGGEMFGLPMHRVVATTEYDLSARGGEGFEARSISVMGQLVRAFGLAKLFGLPSLAPPGPRPFAVLEVDGITFALAVDRLIGQEEAVLRPLFPPLERVKGLAATTVLANGRPLLVLDPRGLQELADSGPRALAKGAA